MKKNNFMLSAFIVISIICGQVLAQTSAEVTKTKTKSNNANDRSANTGTVLPVVELMATATGCNIVLKSDPRRASDASAGKGSATTKQNSFVFSVNAATNVAHEIKSPRDAASGLPTGKTQPGVQVINRATYTWIKDSFNKDQLIKSTTIENGNFTLPESADGKYQLIISWEWTAANGSPAKPGSVAFLVTVANGICTDMAINEKGLSGTKTNTKSEKQ